MALKINLKQNERIIVNGAVITPGKKAGQLVFLNHANILHQHHVLTEDQISSAQFAEGGNLNDSWFYYVIQLFYIDPSNAPNFVAQLADTVGRLLEDFPDKSSEVSAILGLMAEGKLYQALGACREAFPDCLRPRKGSATNSNQIIPVKKSIGIPLTELEMAHTPDSYEKIPSPDADPREIEAWALLKAARRLDNAIRDPENSTELRESLRQNQMLWTIFQTAVAADDCPLPVDVRESVLRLSIFVDTRTFSCLADLDPGKVPALVDLNRNVAIGLTGEAGGGAAMSRPDAPKAADETTEKPVTVGLDC